MKQHTKAEILSEINRRLKKHPGDAPWGCVDCYHGHPCLDREILIAARNWVDQKKTYEPDEGE